jgi:hypothetical protein
MKNSTIVKMTLTLVIIVLGYANSWGQATSPASITDGSSTLQKFGYNSSAVFQANEYVDSLTSGAANVKYLVYPDSIINPLYNFSTSKTANLNSHFVWSLPGAVSIDTLVSGYASNYAKISFPTPGTLPQNYTLSVYEKPNNTGCLGTARSYTVRLIAAPTVTAATFSTLACATGTVPYTLAGPKATLTISTPVSGAKGVIVTYDLTGPTGFTGTITNGSATLGNGNIIDLAGTNLSRPGVYTLTIKTVQDRISVKSGITTTLTTGNTYTFVVNPIPVTGPIYHLPNM